MTRRLTESGRTGERPCKDMSKKEEYKIGETGDKFPCYYDSVDFDMGMRKAWEREKFEEECT